jgi:hypothetical protein
MDLDLDSKMTKVLGGMMNNDHAKSMYMYKGFPAYDLVVGRDSRLKSGNVCVKRKDIMRQVGGKVHIRSLILLTLKRHNGECFEYLHIKYQFAR